MSLHRGHSSVQPHVLSNRCVVRSLGDALGGPSDEGGGGKARGALLPPRSSISIVPLPVDAVAFALDHMNHVFAHGYVRVSEGFQPAVVICVRWMRGCARDTTHQIGAPALIWQNPGDRSRARHVPICKSVVEFSGCTRRTEVDAL